jgi:hypothetical protein
MKIINKREADFLKIELNRECSVSKIKEKMKMINFNLLIQNKQIRKTIKILSLKLIKINNKSQKLQEINIEVNRL